MSTPLGVLMTGGRGKRREHDFYPTQRIATVALIQNFANEIPQDVWEPACGDGAIARVLVDYGYRVHSTDLIDRGYGEGGVDFFEVIPTVSPAIITNPPFNLAAEFIAHSIDIGAEWVAMLLKATYWHAKERLPLVRKYPPNVEAPLTWRLDWTGGGSPTMDCTWFIWSRARTGFEHRPLPKPTQDLFG